jgi:hypothetical protein
MVQTSITDGMKFAAYIGQRYGFAFQANLLNRTRRDFRRLGRTHKCHTLTSPKVLSRKPAIGNFGRKIQKERSLNL